MNSIGTIAGLLSVAFKNSDSIFTILLDPRTGKLMSFLVDDGDEVMEYTYNKIHSGVEYGSDPLQWGLFA